MGSTRCGGGASRRGPQAAAALLAVAAMVLAHPPLRVPGLGLVMIAPLAIDGTPVEAGNHVRLVGAATNRQDAFPGPGEAVYAILSGSFDWLPEGP